MSLASPKQANHDPRKQRRPKCRTLPHLRQQPSNPPTSASISVATYPFFMPPYALRRASSDLEFSFTLSIAARVWEALASSVAPAMCAGVV